jgi:hypothetical protein
LICDLPFSARVDERGRRRPRFLLLHLAAKPSANWDFMVESVEAIHDIRIPAEERF